MGQLETAVRRIDNLYRAWAAVRSNVTASGQAKFKSEIKEISKNPIPYIRKIQSQLQQRRFVFEAQRGVLKTKSSGKKRPLVVSPIANRVVQRAVLNVLQIDTGPFAPLLGDIGLALRTPTSVGGIPKRGVAFGINLVRNAIANGAISYLRSDIREFFTKIPKSKVVDFVRTETKEREFADLFDTAMSTELENAEEIKEYLYLFPLDDVGVPQGSSLSAFAGNVILRDFDQQMNGRNIATIRYIDDFVILGLSEREVRRAFKSAAAILRKLGMEAYGPEDHSDKSKIGRVCDGFDFLGCSIHANGTTPSRKSRQSLLNEIRGTFNAGVKIVEAYIASDQKRRAEEAYVQILARLDRKIRGWGDAYSFSDDRLPFHQMDVVIDKLLITFREMLARRIQNAPPNRRRRALGISLLADTPFPAAPVKPQAQND